MNYFLLSKIKIEADISLIQAIDIRKGKSKTGTWLTGSPMFIKRDHIHHISRDPLLLMNNILNLFNHLLGLRQKVKKPSCSGMAF